MGGKRERIDSVKAASILCALSEWEAAQESGDGVEPCKVPMVAEVVEYYSGAAEGAEPDFGLVARYELAIENWATVDTLDCEQSSLLGAILQRDREPTAEAVVEAAEGAEAMGAAMDRDDAIAGAKELPDEVEAAEEGSKRPRIKWCWTCGRRSMGYDEVCTECGGKEYKRYTVGSRVVWKDPRAGRRNGTVVEMGVPVRVHLPGEAEDVMVEPRHLIRIRKPRQK